MPARIRLCLQRFTRVRKTPTHTHTRQTIRAYIPLCVCMYAQIRTCLHIHVREERCGRSKLFHRKTKRDPKIERLRTSQFCVWTPSPCYFQQPHDAMCLKSNPIHYTSLVDKKNDLVRRMRYNPTSNSSWLKMLGSRLFVAPLSSRTNSTFDTPIQGNRGKPFCPGR